jgi:EAL domain-containing protein (putative c-di-GMP-specific phosphodiesterase class I)
MNISPLQFRQRGFAQRLLRIVDDEARDPSLLQLEITEGALADRVDDAAQVLETLRCAGMRITLDDLGTGCSSLAALAGLPLDQLKIDQSFVQRLGHDRGSRAVAEAIIAMGRMIGAEVIGEGIEHPQSLDYLRRHGCRIAQGHLFSWPLPADEFAAWCRRH